MVLGCSRKYESILLLASFEWLRLFFFLSLYSFLDMIQLKETLRTRKYKVASFYSILYCVQWIVQIQMVLFLGVCCFFTLALLNTHTGKRTGWDENVIPAKFHGRGRVTWTNDCKYHRFFGSAWQTFTIISANLYINAHAEQIPSAEEWNRGEG